MINGENMPKVKDFFERINEIAPFSTAEDWDNVGLQIGNLEKEVKKVLLSLDITDTIVDIAIRKQTDLIICHHPIIFKGIKKIDDKKLLKLIENKISVIVAHTNLDYSRNGVSVVLAETIGLQEIKPLSTASFLEQYLLLVYVPKDYAKKVLSAMLEVGAGLIGNYSHCATYYDINGQYMPQHNSNPFQGQVGNLEITQETKLELHCQEHHLQKILNAMFAVHPYETPAYYLIPLKQKNENFGLGAYGYLQHEMSLIELAVYVKEKLNTNNVKLWVANKSSKTKVKNVAVCGGSGSSIIKEAHQKSDVYISSDFTYHQFLEAAMPVIDAGHFCTENVVIKKINDLIKDFDSEIEMIKPEEHDIHKLEIVN